MIGPVFGAVCAILRVLAPSIATMLFAASVRAAFDFDGADGFGGGDSQSATAPTGLWGVTSAGIVSLSYRFVFFVLAVVCMGIAVCVFAFFRHQH